MFESRSGPYLLLQEKKRHWEAFRQTRGKISKLALNKGCFSTGTWAHLPGPSAVPSRLCCFGRFHGSLCSRDSSLHGASSGTSDAALAVLLHVGVRFRGAAEKMLHIPLKPRPGLSMQKPSVLPPLSLRSKTIREKWLLSTTLSWLAGALFQTLASPGPAWPGDNFLCGSAGLASACRTWTWCSEPQPWKHAGHAHTEAWSARLKDCGQLVASTVASGHQLGDMTPRMLLRMLNELRIITKPVSVKASPCFLE